jgi:hypothetical protein
MRVDPAATFCESGKRWRNAKGSREEMLDLEKTAHQKFW